MLTRKLKIHKQAEIKKNYCKTKHIKVQKY